MGNHISLNKHLPPECQNRINSLPQMSALKSTVQSRRQAYQKEQIYVLTFGYIIRDKSPSVLAKGFLHLKSHDLCPFSVK